jgi:hypothetical protein
MGKDRVGRMLTAVARSGDAGTKTCFVAMPVTTPAPYADELRDADHFGHVLKHLFTPALQQAGYTVIPPKMLGAALIHAEIIRHLEQADLVLADLSNSNPNVFFELGIRTSLDRPVVLVKDARTTKIPFDLGPINILTYDESLATWTLDEEVKRLAEHIGSVATDGSSGNAMWRYFGLTKRGGPAEAGSLEAKVDVLLAEITKLRLQSGTLTGAELIRRTLDDNEVMSLVPGDKVQHDKYGVGVVVSREGTADNPEAKVEFVEQGYGIKHLVLRYAPLIKLSE